MKLVTQGNTEILNIASVSAKNSIKGLRVDTISTLTQFPQQIWIKRPWERFSSLQRLSVSLPIGFFPDYFIKIWKRQKSGSFLSHELIMNFAMAALEVNSGAKHTHLEDWCWLSHAWVITYLPFYSTVRLNP